MVLIVYGNCAAAAISMSWGETCHPFYDDKHRVTEVTPPRLLQQKTANISRLLLIIATGLFIARAGFLDGFVDI